MDLGPPILFENMLIRKMLDLASVNREDIFYDLGCGYAQNLIIAAKHSDIAKGVGFESSFKRAAEARRRVEAAGYSDRIKIMTDDLHNSDLSEATVVFYGLAPATATTEKFVNTMRGGSRFLYYVNCTQPAILPDRMNYPFYMATAPLHEATSEEQWLSAHVPGSTMTIEEYWYELSNIRKDGKLYGFFGTGNPCYIGLVKRLLRYRLKIQR